MWLVSSARTADRPLWSLRVWRSYELIERTDFLRSFTAFLPNSRFALSRLCPEASRYDSRRSLYVCDPDNVEGSHRIAAKRPAEAVRIPSDSGSVDYLGTHYRPSSTSSPTRSFLLHSTPSAPYPSIGSWLVPTTSRRRTSSMENAYTRTPAEALQHFQVREEQGLSDQQVASLREKHGKNGMLTTA